MAGPSLEGIVNPDLLRWARETSRLDRATVAARMGKNITDEKIQQWEEGASWPTITQLRKLARIYKRSIAVFFLDEQPGAATAPRDFRRMELSFQHSMSPALADGIRVAEAKREAALDIYAQSEEEPPAFGLNVDASGDAEQVAQQILAQLGITMPERQEWKSEYEALNGWKAAVESLGVLVMQVSGVGISEMRGCSIALFPLPVILLNSSDKPLGRIFSLMHELVHLVRAESGLCDVIEEANRADDPQRIEAYCNRVAGAILVPLQDLLAQPVVSAIPARRDWSPEDLQILRSTFWASREAVLRRLLIAGRTSQQFYQAERERLRGMFATDEEASSGGFVTFPRKVVLSNGRFLTRLVVGAYDANVITGTELSRILGTKLDHLPKIVGVLREREAA